MTTPLTRRGFLVLGGSAATGLALPGGAVAAGPAHTAGGAGGSSAASGVGPVDVAGSDSPEARAYHRLLLEHTRWVRTLWDESAGHYPLSDFYFINVLGNAVLVTSEGYDADVAGIDREHLLDQTVRTIEHFAATNFFAVGATWGDGSYEWGGRIYWDGTMESYFVAAARLLWDHLGEQARVDVDAIAVGGADYVVSLGTTEDPRSGGWSSNGLQGGFRADSKIEEMGAKSMPIATGLAYFPDHPSAPAWREWLTRWMSNMTGLPATDEHDDTPLEGRPVSSWNEAQNLYDTFIVENHGPYAPMYQESVGAYPGRNAIHFLIAGQPLLDVFGYQPNADELWRTLRHLGAGAGLTAHPMIADRYHLYGRDVLPLTWRRIGQADPHVGYGERLLIDHLGPYLAYPPVDRLTKFSGEAKYEPEARAEVAIAYLLHRWRDRLHGDVEPVSEQEYWADVTGVTDYGSDVGLVGHQDAAALSMVVTKPGYVKFAFLPEHDDWLFDVAGASPCLLPSTRLDLREHTTTVYTEDVDGFYGSASVVDVTGGFAGFATLPGGVVVYATTGIAANDAALRLHAFDMPGVPGLDGDRTFHGADGSVTLDLAGGDGGVDEASFAGVQARYVRMRGARPATQYGYSLWAVEVFAPDGEADLAQGRPTTASSYDPAYPPVRATDGDSATRWAVSRAERPRVDSWLAVDLGERREVGRVRLSWETAYGAEYAVQVSQDGEAWQDVVSVPAARTFPGEWVNVDDRAGFVVRGGSNPIRATATSLTLSAGPAQNSTGVLVEGYAGVTAERTAELAGATALVTEPAALVASAAADFLSLFNLSAQPLTGSVRWERRPDRDVLYQGMQRVNAEGHTVAVLLDPLTAQIRAPRFTVEPLRGTRREDVDVHAEVLDAATVALTGSGARKPLRLRVTSLRTGAEQEVVVPSGRSVTVGFDG